MFSAEAVQRGVSLLKDRVGEIIGSELITIVDDPFKAKSPRSGSFDSEGVATQYKEMVKDGKLTGYLHNLKTAKKANTKLKHTLSHFDRHALHSKKLTLISIKTMEQFWL